MRLAGDKYFVNTDRYRLFHCVCVCVVCERACTVDMSSTEAETLNNAARRAGWPLLHLLRQVLGEMLMMQCADPNTLPAPSRLHQLGQSLSLSLSPSASFINPYPFFSFLPLIVWKKEGAIVCFFLYCPAFALISLPPPAPLACNMITLTSSSMSCRSHFFFYQPSVCLVGKMPFWVRVRDMPLSLPGIKSKDAQVL